MKWGLILVLSLLIALLGCTPIPKGESAETPKAEEVGFDEAMGKADSNVAPGTWLTDYDEALALAKKLERPVLINFTGSDWCGWCIKLAKEVFTQDVFIKHASENYVLLKLDFPRKIEQSAEMKAANESLAKKYGIEGFPTIVFVDHTGKELTRASYQPGGPEAYIKYLQGLLNNSK